jgi:hypothetical protein
MANTSEAAYLHDVVPFRPMEAELVRELPEGDGWQYEPKAEAAPCRGIWLRCA